MKITELMKTGSDENELRSEVSVSSGDGKLFKVQLGSEGDYIVVTKERWLAINEFIVNSMESISNNCNLTIAELYKWAVEKGIEDYSINIQYRDEGGDYSGKDEELVLNVDDKSKIVTL